MMANEVRKHMAEETQSATTRHMAEKKMTDDKGQMTNKTAVKSAAPAAKPVTATKPAAPAPAVKAAPAAKPAAVPAPASKPIAKPAEKPAPVAKPVAPAKPATEGTRVFVPKAPATAPTAHAHAPRPERIVPSAPVKVEDVRVKKTGGTKIKMNGTRATGRRKKSVARVRLVSGSGKIVINGRPMEEYFASGFLQLIVNQPLVAAQNQTVDVLVNVHGGGLTGQAGAIRHGIARALIKDNEQLKPDLKKKGFLKRDPRMKERKKYGLKKARRAPQFSKR